MSTFVTLVDLAAAVCTTGANLPQLKKAWTTGSGAYGLLEDDIVIILANGISLTLIGGLLYLKMKQSRL